MRITFLLASLLSTLSIVATTPILETRQPASCAADCYFSISEQQFNDPSTLQLIESSSPGCGTCPGHNCTGKADATITSLDGKTQWIYEYWVRHCRILDAKSLTSPGAVAASTASPSSRPSSAIHCI